MQLKMSSRATKRSKSKFTPNISTDNLQMSITSDLDHSDVEETLSNHNEIRSISSISPISPDTSRHNYSHRQPNYSSHSLSPKSPLQPTNEVCISSYLYEYIWDGLYVHTIYRQQNHQKWSV